MTNKFFNVRQRSNELTTTTEKVRNLIGGRTGVARYVTLLLLVFFGLGVSQSAWADNEKLNSGFIKYSFNGGDDVQWDFSSSDKNVATRNLGTLTSDFKVTNMSFQFSDNWSTHSSQCPNMHMAYSYDNYASKAYFTTDNWSYNWSTWWIYKAQDWTVKSYTDASGNYSMKFYFHMWWPSTSKTSDINNNDAGYIFTFTILPPAATNLQVTPSGADIKSGTGTESDPLILVGNGSFKITAVASKERDDDNSNVNIKFGDDAYSMATEKTISNVTNTEVQSIDIKACCINGSLMGAESSTTTIYYKVEPAYTITVVSENVNKGTVDKASVTAYQYGQADNSITATPKAGFDFAAWTKSVEGITVNSPSNATTTLKASDEGTVTATFAYKTPSVSHTGTATFQIGGAAIKLNPTYTDVASDATYTWSGTGVTFTPSADVANPNVSVETAGEYTITVEVSQGGKSASKGITLTASAYSGAECGTCFGHTAQ